AGDALDVVGQHAPQVRHDEFQPVVALQHATEDHAVDGDAAVHDVTQGGAQVEVFQPARAGGRHRVHEDDHAAAVDLVEYGGESGIIESHAVYVRAEAHPHHAQLAHAAVQLRE